METGTSKCQALSHPGDLFICWFLFWSPKLDDRLPLQAHDVNLVARVIKGMCSPQIIGLILRGLTMVKSFKF